LPTDNETSLSVDRDAKLVQVVAKLISASPSVETAAGVQFSFLVGEVGQDYVDWGLDAVLPEPR
jgi:hypothetical protein